MMTGIKTIRINGLEQYQVVLRGCIVSQHWSREFAKAECLRLVNRLKETI